MDRRVKEYAANTSSLSHRYARTDQSDPSSSNSHRYTPYPPQHRHSPVREPFVPPAHGGGPSSPTSAGYSKYSSREPTYQQHPHYASRTSPHPHAAGRTSSTYSGYPSPRNPNGGGYNDLPSGLPTQYASHPPHSPPHWRTGNLPHPEPRVGSGHVEPTGSTPNRSSQGQQNPHLHSTTTGDVPINNNLLSGYSAEDNWFMPWICSTPGVTPTYHQPVGAGPTSTSSFATTVLSHNAAGADTAAAASGPWGDLSADTHSYHHSSHRPKLDDEMDSRLSGIRRTGSYQTSRMRSHPGTPPDQGDSHNPPAVPTSAGSSQFQQPLPVVAQTASRTSSVAAAETPLAHYQPAAQLEDIAPWTTALTFLNLYHEHL